MTDIAALLETQPSQLKLSEVVDAYKALNQIRLAMQKETEAVEAVEKAYKQHLINSVEKGESKGVFGLLYKAQHKTKRIPKIASEETEVMTEEGPRMMDGWTALHYYIFQTGRFDLLQKRMNDSAIMEMYEAGELPPGVETMQVSEISVTKI